jgi:RNA polymerase sigma-70 factor (ECF subfamily)
MLGSVQDADDALQEALLGAWRGFAGFEGRSSVRAWLYKIATNACLQLSAQRRGRHLPAELRAASDPGVELERRIEGPLWLEPYPDDPAASFEQREQVELAFVAALQYLPATQRAALLAREVLGFAAGEVAELLDTSPASVESALQRARQSLAARLPTASQQATLRDLGEARQRDLVERYIGAWHDRDVAALTALLTEDVRFDMPPLPGWFSGRDDVARFFGERVFSLVWELRPTRASGQLAFACYAEPDFRTGALNVITLRADRISAITGFLDPAVHAKFTQSAR